MITAIKTVSQVVTHMSIAFSLTYLLTGSLALGGLAAIIEPVLNVALLPKHEKAWHAIRHRYAGTRLGLAAVAGEKISQTLLHISVAFGVLYWATGSMAFGGFLAIVEPICNVIALPIHDRMWERLRTRLESRGAALAA